uniref:Uncharacterized protein n=1 Tax=Amphimedon queenslandica TaxID=400682 RepID=A0A1X7TVU2_AMPQE
MRRSNLAKVFDKDKEIHVDTVQAAYEKLKDIIWLYGNLDDESLDDVAKKVI